MAVTDAERRAVRNQTAISGQNVRDVQSQLRRQLSNYDYADRQNRAMADDELEQNSRKGSADRFEQQRALQSSALGLMGAMGSAMNGSTTANLMRMLEDRNDLENNTFWAQHQVNQDAVENAYRDSLNQNNLARRDSMQSAEKAIRDITNDWSAYMNNINPELFPEDRSLIDGDKKLAPSTAWQPKRLRKYNATTSGYVIPDNRGAGMAEDQSMNMGARRNAVRGGDSQSVGGDYFSRLVNRSNRNWR